MANNPDHFCGNCGNPRVVGKNACPHCGSPYGATYTGPLENPQGTTQLTPTEAVPRLTQPILGNTSSPQYSGVMPPIQPTAGNFSSPQYSGVMPPIPPGPVPPPQGKSLPLGKIIIGQGVAIVLLLVVLIVVLLVRSSPTPDSGPGQAIAPGATATPAIPATPTLIPTATNTPAPTATNTPVPKPGDLLCNVDIGSWDGGSADWKLLNGRLLNDGSGGGASNGPTKVAPCQLGNIANYAVEAKMQVTHVDIYGGGNFGITVRGTPSSSGWQGYVACLCGSNATLSALGSDNKASGSFDPGTSVHTYRVEVKDNVINFFIDGGLVVTLTDNEFFTGSQVGLWCEADQLEVFSFQVFAV
jgi:hypothetical protein